MPICDSQTSPTMTILASTMTRIFITATPLSTMTMKPRCGCASLTDLQSAHPCLTPTSCDRADLLSPTSLATETDYVCGRLAKYTNDLLSLGVNGLWLDAAKHAYQMSRSGPHKTYSTSRGCSRGGVGLGPSGEQLYPATPELTAWQEKLADSSQ